MIWDLIVVLGIVIILVILGRRLPDARAKMVKVKETSDEKISLYGVLAQADEAFEKKNYRQAESLYVKAALSDPDDAKIYSRLGAIYLEQRNYYDAKDAFLQAVKIEPDISARHINLGLAYSGLKDYFKAVEEFKKAVMLDPRNKKYKNLLERAQKSLDREKKRSKQ